VALENKKKGKKVAQHWEENKMKKKVMPWVFVLSHQPPKFNALLLCVF
jgi:hypothetical protein